MIMVVDSRLLFNLCMSSYVCTRPIYICMYLVMFFHNVKVKCWHCVFFLSLCFHPHIYKINDRICHSKLTQNIHLKLLINVKPKFYFKIYCTKVFVFILKYYEKVGVAFFCSFIKSWLLKQKKFNFFVNFISF